MKYNGKEIWEEDPAVADDYRQRYVDGINEYVEKMNIQCKTLRRMYMPPKKLVMDQERYRKEYLKMLGVLPFLENGVHKVESFYVGRDEVCSIYRLSIYISEEIPFYVMYLLPHKRVEPTPLVIAQHGGGGTPELCCDMNGKNNYNHMVQRVLERGAAVLAPQLLLWSMTEIATMRAHDVPHDRGKVDNNLKRFGSSITGMEIAGIMKSIDYVCKLKEIDADKIAMLGLSYGGYFTLYTMAADTRIKAGYSAAAFNDRDKYDWTDWSYPDSAHKFQDAEVAALCAPRKLYLQVGKEDQVFTYESAVLEAERIHDYYIVFQKPENFRFSVWEGGHTVSDHSKGYDFIFKELT